MNAKRRAFLKTVAVGSTGSVLVNALARPARGGDKDRHFTFLGGIPRVGGPEVLLLNGCGDFNAGSVAGGGSFTIFNPDPLDILAFGTWQADELISFVPTEPRTFGAHAAGILTIAARAASPMPEGKGGKVATVKIVCNLPGLQTGESEGVTVTLEDGTTFSGGIGTLFS